jgi:hypothetical protein
MGLKGIIQEWKKESENPDLPSDINLQQRDTY